MKIAKYLVQLSEVQDLFLTKPLFPVNIRLLIDSKGYREVIENAVRYMKHVLETEYEDYSKLQGLSGANVGIPFNIVLLAKKKEQPTVLINPVVVKHSKDTRVIESNCGSINLPKPIEVERWKWVDVKFNDINHALCTEKTRRFNLGTVQHEIDHNNGTLIINKVKL